MTINSGDVENALNTFRALMKPCFINSASFDNTEFDLGSGSGIEIPPKISADSGKITNNGLTADTSTYDPIQTDKISEATYKKIKLGVEINTYIPYDKYTLQNIRTAVGSDLNVRSTHREYLSHLIYHYIQLIILSAVAIKITTQSGKLYD